VRLACPLFASPPPASSRCKFASPGLTQRATRPSQSVSESIKPDGIKCGTFRASAFEQRQLATGDHKGRLRIWDVARADKALFDVAAHTSMVNCIDGCGGLNVGGGAPEIVTGGRDGCVRVWDPRVPEAVTALEPANPKSSRDCWAVAFGNSFNDEERCVAAGYDNGDIKLLDLRMNKLRWETNIKNGVVSLEFDRRDVEMNKLLATTLESTLCVFDMRTFHPKTGYASVTRQPHSATVWVGAHTPQNRDIFVTTDGKGFAHLHKYQYPDQRRVKDADGIDTGVAGTIKELATQNFSSQPVVSFDWNADKFGLAVLAALDEQIKVVMATRLAQQ
jgi:WD40 repeat protein